MGYYSDVAIGMSKEDGVRFLAEQTKGMRDEPWLIEAMKTYNYEDCFVAAWFSVKWYDNSPAVQWVNQFLQDLEDEEKPVAYVRVGEALDDNEEWFSYDDEHIQIGRAHV